MSPNQLQHETSPYLLQHAENPVQWIAWSEDAFARAVREDKPVFLSAGYSSCHWCHVMAHESFEDAGIAEILNQHFIPVKVDREERPDVDALYMLATQILTGRGGWPNSVFLLPDQRPFFAGTYWPIEDRGGYAGFRSVLRRLVELWEKQREDVERQAESITERLRVLSAPEPAPKQPANPLVQWTAELKQHFDPVNGGFEESPKFPPHNTLLTLLELERGEERDHWLTKTLDGMALGGVRDQVGGAFHRYSTDATWFLPHFEVMLVDNAQLAEIYARAATRFDSEAYAGVAVGICEAMLRDFRLEGGVFATAWDADSEQGEGEYYLWKFSELQQLLGKRADAFCRAYQAVESGNAMEEATGRPLGKNVLYPSVFPDEGLLGDLQQLLSVRRQTRQAPFMDDKVLTAWNGLLIRGFAVAGRELGRPDFTKAARECAETLWTWNRDGLRRSFRHGKEGPAGVLEDYTFFAYGLLALEEVEKARGLMQEVENRFQTAEGGYTVGPRNGPSLLIAQEDPYDSAVPSGIGVAVQVWEALGETEKAVRIRTVYSGAIHRSARATQNLWCKSNLY